MHYINLCENVLKRCDNIRSQSRPLLFQFPSRTALLLRIKHINGKNCDNLWVNCVLISTDFSTLHGNKFENAKCFEQFVEPETAKSAPTTYVILTQYYLFSGFHEIRQKLMTSTGWPEKQLYHLWIFKKKWKNVQVYLNRSQLLSTKKKQIKCGTSGYSSLSKLSYKSDSTYKKDKHDIIRSFPKPTGTVIQVHKKNHLTIT